MSAGRLNAREEPEPQDRTDDEAAALERGLEALAFLERSRELAAEPVDPAAGPLDSQAPPGAARPQPPCPRDPACREASGRPGEIHN